MRHLLIALALGLSGCVYINDTQDGASATRTQSATAEIVSVLERQAAAWNAGDIDAFMQDYWKDEELRFGSGGNILRGWQATRDRYKTTYKDRAAMGVLTFSDLDVQVLAADASVVHGRWALAREVDKPGGLFTLVFRNFGDGWVIVSDTTTSANAQ